MDFDTARKIVISDQRQSWGEEEMTDEECIEHVRNTVNPNTLDEGDPLNAEAYRIVLG